MKRFIILLVLLLMIGCGSDGNGKFGIKENDLNTLDKKAIVKTEIVAQGNISAYGGELVSDNGTIGIEVPAGQLDSDVEMKIIVDYYDNGDKTFRIEADRVLKKDIEIILNHIPNESDFIIQKDRSVKKDTRESSSYPDKLWGSISALYKNFENGLEYRLTPSIGSTNIILKAQESLEFTLATIKASTKLYSSKDYDDRTFVWTNSEPVLFIHGYEPSVFLFGGGDGTWGIFPQLIGSLDIDKTTFVPFEFRWKTNDKFQDVANDLAKAIKIINQHTGKKVHIVAHSFGGIVVRSLIQQINGINHIVGNDAIATVTTLGTPHSGIFDEEGEKNGIYFPRGYDDGWGTTASLGCSQISCYQLGDDVLKTKGKIEELDINTTLGSVAIQIQEEPWSDIPLMVGKGYSKSEDQDEVLGDRLISLDGQKFYANDELYKKYFKSDLIKEKFIGYDDEKKIFTPKYGYRHTSLNVNFGQEGPIEIFSETKKELLKNLWAEVKITDKNCKINKAIQCEHGSFKLVYKMLSDYAGKADLSVIKPDKPQNLSSISVLNKIWLKWGITKNTYSYQVYVSKKPDFSIYDSDLYDISEKLATTSYSLFAPSEGTLYFKVVAFNQNGEMAISDTATIIDYISLLSGTITDYATNTIIKGAQISIKIADKTYERLTNKDGFFYIKAANIVDYLNINISAPGYFPKSIVLTRDMLKNNKYILENISLTPMTEADVLVEGGNSLYHLGDDWYGGMINSQFQTTTMGIESTFTFTLTQSQIDNYSTLRWYVTVKGVNPNYYNNVYINDNISCYLGESPSDGSYNENYCDIVLNDDIFHSGLNTIRFTSNWGSIDYDDFEFTNIYIKLLELKTDISPIDSNFQITNFDFPSVITVAPSEKERKNYLTINWDGLPTYPITLELAYTKCAQGWGCLNESSKFYEAEIIDNNILEYQWGCWSNGVYTGSSGTFEYEAKLIDANGKETKPISFTYTCVP